MLQLDNTEYTNQAASLPEQEFPETTSKTASKGFARGFALLIGVGKTPNAPMYSLSETVTDVRVLERVLTDRNMAGYDVEHVHSLVDSTANVAKICAELQWLAEKAIGDATVVVYFSGHGWKTFSDQSPSGERYCLVTSELDLNNIEGTVIWADKFVKLLSRITAKRLLVLIDTCHAAGMVSPRGEEISLPRGFKSTVPLKSLFHELGRGEGRAVISASKAGQSSYSHNFPPGTLRMGIPVTSLKHKKTG